MKKIKLILVGLVVVNTLLFTFTPSLKESKSETAYIYTNSNITTFSHGKGYYHC